MSDSPTIREIGRVRRGREYITVSACADGDSIWVQMRLHHGRPWQMTPEIARDLGGLLDIAALTSEAFDRHPHLASSEAARKAEREGDER